jgi:DNA-binding MarR family transcriptional regulator
MIMPDPTTLQDQILMALRRITRAIDLRSRSLLQDYGLTAPQLATLNTVFRLQPVTVGDIAREIHLGKATVTGILNRLEKRRLIQRARGDQDRRSVVVSLTPEGQQTLSAAPSLLQDEFQHELDKLKEWERTQILATLQRIADMMDASGIEAAPLLTSELADATLNQGALHVEEVAALSHDAEDLLGPEQNGSSPQRDAEAAGSGGN